jgi:cytochrome c-type biogenesis protein CcmH/NrfG
MSSGTLVPVTATGLEPRGASLPPVPWRDPYSVSPKDLAVYIEQLEAACAANPASADLRTCLGMAHAVNYDVYKSMDALEEARAIDPDNFWAQLKYAELHYRLRALNRAEEETRRAAELASNPFQLAIARKQMKDIRELLHSSVRNVEWTKPLKIPVLVLSAMLALIFIVMTWR